MYCRHRMCITCKRDDKNGSQRLSVTFVPWYQNFAAGFLVVLLGHRGGRGAVVRANPMVPAPFLAVTAIVTANIRLIRTRQATVRPLIRPFIVKYVRQKAPGSH